MLRCRERVLSSCPYPETLFYVFLFVFSLSWDSSKPLIHPIHGVNYFPVRNRWGMKIDTGWMSSWHSTLKALPCNLFRVLGFMAVAKQLNFTAETSPLFYIHENLTILQKLFFQVSKNRNYLENVLDVRISPLWKLEKSKFTNGIYCTALQVKKRCE